MTTYNTIYIVCKNFSIVFPHTHTYEFHSFAFAFHIGFVEPTLGGLLLSVAFVVLFAVCSLWRSLCCSFAWFFVPQAKPECLIEAQQQQQQQQEQLLLLLLLLSICRCLFFPLPNYFSSTLLLLVSSTCLRAKAKMFIYFFFSFVFLIVNLAKAKAIWLKGAWPGRRGRGAWVIRIHMWRNRF